jgi:hypothetical protein
VTTLVTTDVVDGTTIDAADLNNNLTAIKNVVNGNIDNAIAISKLAGYPADAAKRLAGDGTWVANTAGQTWTYAAAAPVSPTTGDIWVYRDADPDSTISWAFRYNAGNTTYDWEFIGGAPGWSTVDTQENFTSGGSIHDLTTAGPIFTVPLAGTYLVRWGANMTPQTGGAFNSTCVAEIWNGTSAQLGSKVIQTSNQGSEQALATADRITGLSAATDIRMRYKNSISGGSVGYARFRFVEVTPIRVSG